MAAPVLQFKRGLLANLPGLRAGEPGFTTDSYDLYVGIDSTTNNNKFFGSHRYWTRDTSSTGSGVNFVEGTSNGTSYITLKSPDSLAGVTTFTLPSADGSNGQFLKTNGSGVLSFADVSTSLSIAGDTGTDTVVVGTDTFTFAGTANEIETAVTNNQVQIGLPSNVIVGGALTVSGNTTLGDSGSDLITVVGVATFNTSNVYINNQLFVGGVQVTGGAVIGEDIITRNFKATGVSTFVGSVTFEGGTITLGDATTDNVVFTADVNSNIIPNIDDTYDLGNGSQRWRNASFAGIVTAATGAMIDGVQIGINGTNVIDTAFGNLTLDSASGQTIIDDAVTIQNNLTVNGNVTIGGTTVSLRGEDVYIENKDIILGYTTSVSPNDDTANHSGVAIASTEGTPLTSFAATGINTLPDTYKQLMWFKSGTLGFSTDAFAFNYGVAIGTTTMGDGIRLAVGSVIEMTDTDITATTFNGSLSGNASSADQVKAVTASDTNATYYITFVDANNGSATNESVYTDDGIYYNPGTNTFTTQNALFTNNVEVQGTITGTATTATRAQSIDVVGVATNQNYYITLVDSSGNSKSVGVDSELLYNPNTNTFTVGTGVGITQFSSSVSTGSSTSSVPNSSAVINYVGTQISNIDLTTSTAGDTGTGSVSTSQTLTIAGTAGEVETSASGQTITIGLPDAVVVGTSLSAPTIKVATLQHSNATQAATIDSSGNITASQNLTVSGNLYVNGSTTQVNTSALTVEDRTIELGAVDGSAPSATTTWDLGVLFNYYDGSAKKSALVWEQGDARFKLGSVISDGGGTGNDSPQITFTTYAPLEIGALWVNDCAGQSQVISCTGSTRNLENITIDAGTF
jgi:hypothetical protein